MDDTEPTVNSVKESEQSVGSEEPKELEATDKQLESSNPKVDAANSECVKQIDIESEGIQNHIEEKSQSVQLEIESIEDDEVSKPSIDSDVKSDDTADNKNTDQEPEKLENVDIKEEYKAEATNDNNEPLTEEDSQPEVKDDSPDQSEFKDEESQTSKTNDDQSEVSTDKETASKSIPDDAKDDDIENPQFENAPNLPDEPQDDHTQALDPFDALLKDSSATAEPSTSNTQVNLDDEDDHNADESHCDSNDLETDEPNLDDSGSVDPGEEPGAYEEVCLLPDTERELSEADKAEAEKTLALKRQQAAEALFTTEETKENESTNKDDQIDLTQENGADKDVDNEVIDVDSDSEQSMEIYETQPTLSRCVQCSNETLCHFNCTKVDETLYICTDACLKQFLSINGSKYKLQLSISNKYIIEEIEPNYFQCSDCEDDKLCFFFYKCDGNNKFYCSVKCLENMMGDEKDKYKFIRRRIYVNKVEPKEEICTACNNVTLCSYKFERYNEVHYVCGLPCIKILNDAENRYHLNTRKAPEKLPLLKLKVMTNATDKYLGDKIQTSTPTALQAAREDRAKSFKRICTQCDKEVVLGEKNLIWEAMDFCDEVCLASFQNKIGAKCVKCKTDVQHSSLGKYCVRFGYDIRQFCNSSCLDEFKKGLKICCFCQRDISAEQEGFLAPVGDKRQFKDFCSQKCMEQFDQINMNSLTQPALKAVCAVCSLEKPTTINVESGDDNTHRLCSEPCFAAFKFVNNLTPDQCKWCKKYFERKPNNAFTIYDEETPLCFCSKSCLNIYISTSRHIVPCNWCKVKKYNYDMIRKDSKNGAVMMCSLNCFNLYQVSVNVFSTRRIKCDLCNLITLAQYHLTMSDATLRNFCSYQCVMKFQSQYSVNATLVQGSNSASMPKPTGAPRRTIGNSFNNASKQQIKAATQRKSSLPVISRVQSLANNSSPAVQPRNKSKRTQDLEPPPKPITPPPKPPTPPPPPPKIFNHVLVKTIPPVQVSNKATLTKPMVVSRGVSCRPHPCTKECQTDPSLERRVLIPIPVPIYVPVPCAMYSLPFPIPVPIPIPIPTPVFIPTTRNSAKGIMKEISKIHDKMPTDPFEAELLMMAEMVAGDKKKDQSDSETDEENAPEDGFSPVAMDGNNAFGEDMLQMALKMATEYEEPAVDLESAMTANTITPSSHPGMPGMEGESMHHHHMMVLEQQRAVAALRASAAPRKRTPHSPAPTPRPARGKRRRTDPAPPPPEPVREPAEKPDANMCLKYTFGVNAWKQWVMTKNAEIEKSSIRRKPFKSEILQLTADELNYSLCLFVKEVRKPNGSEYAPDTIYYLVLGIQQYLFENSRIDNIFTDPYYEKFTDCLDEVAKKFSILYNDSQYIVTRVEEEHLWESKQLGAHSPHVLLSTLMFFNTKHFNLVTVEEHMQLSFSHIMKHWKRNPNQPGQAKLPGSRNVLLRFYPPQSALEANSRKKKVYEQQENEENPLRCPVKLYEFYISKCPESVRTRNDVFYLQPERSCVPDSPVWYSTQPLSREALSKMLHRVKMVKEINIALLTS